MEKDGNYRISVCMPVYNGERYIAEAIDSVLSQSYDNFEFIICDNCSSDDTGRIVHSHADPRIRYYRNEKNIGPVPNVNRCLELSRADYICIFHHDDVMLQNNFAEKVRILDENPNIGLVHSNISLIDEEGRMTAENIWNKDSAGDYIRNGADVFKSHLSYMPRGASIFIGAALVRKECYEKLGGFETRLPHCNDSEMWLKIALYYDIACIGKPLVLYRVHKISASSSWGNHLALSYFDEHLKTVDIIFDKYPDQIGALGITRMQIDREFGLRALYVATRHISNGNYPTAGQFIKKAIALNPKLAQTKPFYKAMGKWLLGDKGNILYSRLKNGVKEKSLLVG